MSENIIKIESVQDKLQIELNQRKKLVNSFAAGIFFGVGSAIGATIVFGLIIFVLGQLNTVPFVGEYIQDIVDYIQQSTQ
jgi:hypothetical protein